MVKWVGLGYKSHLSTIAESVSREQWIKIDAQICSVIKFNVHTSLKLIFCPHETVHQFGVRPVPFILNFS